MPAPVLETAAMTRVRWAMLALVFFATTVNYLDRILLGFLIPVIRDEMSISEKEYGFITGAFQLTYTIGFLFAGRFIDGVGTRVGYAVSLVWWSLAAAGHAIASGPVSLAIWRALLGFGEAGNFPAAIRSVAEWFPRRDRAFATGVFNAGTNVASMIGPPLFAALTAAFGWRACFAITASLGVVWLILWLLLYQHPSRHGRVSPAELGYIQSDSTGPDTAARMPWAEALSYRQTWGFAAAKFLTDPVWWFYLFWLPLYLFDVRKFQLSQIAWALPFIYLMADIGSVGGGWISSYLIRRGWPTARARKTAMGLCAASMPVAAMAVLAGNPLLAIALVSLATAAHQGWSANLFTTVSDVFPKRATASITGIGGCFGGLGGLLFSAVLPGYIVTHFGYTPVFLTMGGFHLIALLAVHVWMGDLRPIEDHTRPRA